MIMTGDVHPGFSESVCMQQSNAATLAFAYLPVFAASSPTAISHIETFFIILTRTRWFYHSGLKSVLSQHDQIMELARADWSQAVDIETANLCDQCKSCCVLQKQMHAAIHDTCQEHDGRHGQTLRLV